MRKNNQNKLLNLYQLNQFYSYIVYILLHNRIHKMENYYKMWIERCEYMKTQNLPKDWNGVFIATTK